MPAHKQYLNVSLQFYVIPADVPLNLQVAIIWFANVEGSGAFFASKNGELAIARDTALLVEIMFEAFPPKQCHNPGDAVADATDLRDRIRRYDKKRDIAATFFPCGLFLEVIIIASGARKRKPSSDALSAQRRLASNLSVHYPRHEVSS